MASIDAHLLSIHGEANDLACIRVLKTDSTAFPLYRFILNRACVYYRIPRKDASKMKISKKRKTLIPQLLLYTSISEKKIHFGKFTLSFSSFFLISAPFLRRNEPQSDHKMFVWLMFSSQYLNQRMNSGERFILIENFEWISPTKRRSHSTCQRINEI